MTLVHPNAIGWLEHTGELCAVRQVKQPGRLPPFADPWARVRLRRDDVEIETRQCRRPVRD